MRLSAGVVCAGGCLGILIPPSIMLILYGATAGVSPVQLYAGALFPGLMLAGMYMLYVIIRVMMQSGAGATASREERNVPFLPLSTNCSLPLCRWRCLIFSVLGAIMFGIATPSEAAAIGALGALILAAAYRSLTFEKLKESVYLTARTSAMVGWLFVGSFTFSAVFAILGGDAVIKDFVVGLDLSPFMFLLVTQIIIFILGWPLEWTEIIVIFVPIFLPLLDHFGIDPLFFGILDCAQHPDFVPVAAGGHGALLPEGRGAQACDHQRHLRRRHAVYLHCGRLPWCCSTFSRPSACGCRSYLYGR